MNQGAESVICGLLSLLVVSAQLDKEVEQAGNSVITPARNDVAADESARRAVT
jgi:hypothetical protein